MGVGGIWKGFTQQEWFYLPIDRITIFVWKGGCQCHGTWFDPEIGETTQGLGQHPNCSLHTQKNGLFFPFTSSTVDQSPHISTISLDSNIVHINQLITCHKLVINQPEIIISDHFRYEAVSVWSRGPGLARCQQQAAILLIQFTHKLQLSAHWLKGKWKPETMVPTPIYTYIIYIYHI